MPFFVVFDIFIYRAMLYKIIDMVIRINKEFKIRIIDSLYQLNIRSLRLLEYRSLSYRSLFKFRYYCDSIHPKIGLFFYYYLKKDEQKYQPTFTILLLLPQHLSIKLLPQPQDAHQRPLPSLQISLHYSQTSPISSNSPFIQKQRGIL